MQPYPDMIAELNPLLEALCEERLTASEAVRLERLVLGSEDARWYYITYVDLHGSLFWNAAGLGSADALSSESIPSFAGPIQTVARKQNATTKPFRRNAVIGLVATAACLVIAVVLSRTGKSPDREAIVHSNSTTIAQQPLTPAPVAVPSHRTNVRPIELAQDNPLLAGPKTDRTTTEEPKESIVTVPPPPAPQHEDLDSTEVVAAIDAEIRRGWEVSAIHPSPKADDAEWLRRVTLDLWGRIPTIDEAEAFLASKRPNKRAELVDTMLDDGSYARNFTTIWSNLLIGRRPGQHVNRSAFHKFLRTAFAANRPWNQIVYDLVAAEGNNAENGATNFLIAHLNNDALPATAVTARVFLCEQIQCNRCHNNPFNKSSQIAYWEMHSFFSQTVSVPRKLIEAGTGRAQYAYTELATQTAGGPSFFESQNGIMRVAYPRFAGQSVDASPETNRRATLGRLMTEGNQPQLAAAFVNRLWGHFFGNAFTHDVDDMGPHSPASHPELLRLLAGQFIRSGYDTKQLIRWICNSEAYRLSSRYGADNQDDEAVEGQLPRFSRMYVKSMTPEQMYDSFITATRAHRAGGLNWEQAETQRQQWLAPFVVDYNTDENDEAMELDGNLSQALTLMNGPLIEKALEASSGTLLGEVVRRRTSEKEKIRELYLAVLSRPPSPVELSNVSKLVRQDANAQAAHGTSKTTAETESYQDLFWVLLNSNEFAIVH